MPEPTLPPQTNAPGRLNHPLSWIRFDVSVLSLILVNFIPVFGGLFLGWDIRGILLVYWAENLVVGFYNVLKMIMARAPNQQAKLFVIPFFIFHFGGFCAGHGFFILMFLTSGIAGEPLGQEFELTGNEFDWPGPLVFLGIFLNVVMFIWEAFGNSILVPVLGLLISHGISFKQNFIDRGEYKQTDLMVQMFMPYGRIVIMHIAIIFAAVPIFLLGSPMPLLILLIVFKTAVDVFFHSWSHRGTLEAA